MARSTTTTTVITVEEVNNFFDQEVAAEARSALSSDNPFWKGIEWFLNWLRENVKNFLQNQLVKLPVVGNWAGRIAVTVTEFCFTVIGTLIHFLKVVFCSKSIWTKAHEAAMKAWENNENNGLLAQIYSYGKKMAGYFLEIIKQCLERAIKAHGLEVSEDEKQDISSTLDSLLS